ncbi:MAG: GNAT family N-acetyltransferase [bacterium]|nr:GNAT family N-acetyltransferase [bacterium]
MRHDDAREARPLIQRCIDVFGWSPEHNTDYFFHSAEPDLQNIFFNTPEGWGLLAQVSDTQWYLFAEPLAPKEERAELLVAFSQAAFESAKTKKVTVELTSQTRRDFLKKLHPVRSSPAKRDATSNGVHPDLRSCAIAETFLWPVLDLEKHDPEYPGSRYKSLRNTQSRFLREHRVKVKSAVDIGRDELHDLVWRWEKGRRASHQSVSGAYHALIDDSFAGTIGARSLVVDGRPEALMAGWLVPNSKTYYMAISLHSYAHWGLGEVSLMEDLRWMQEQGFTAVDLGGSDKKLFAFKRQFGDVVTHKTHQFSIVKN